MSTVRDMLRRKGSEVYSVTSNETVYETLTVMSMHNTGAVLVMSEGKLEGIVSERDCVRKVDLVGKNAKTTKVSEIMTAKVITIDAGQDLEECMNLMIDNNIRHLPVYDNGKLMGLISVRDMLKEVVDYQRSLIEQLEQYIKG
ncbi:MAG: putative signal transduction protein with CBS domain [Chloroflexi bacterium OLB14]|nr:MAG: putative signal transduction protein with CBS domain [Chloroflexi bacterium OLB14]